MAKPKSSGFLTAIIIAVVSFFVVFFFFPDAANKCLGVSFRKGNSSDIEKVVNETKEKVAEQVTQTITDKVSQSVRNLID